jgi:deltex-like protein
MRRPNWTMRRNKLDKQTLKEACVIDISGSDEEEDRKPAAVPFELRNQTATTDNASSGSGLLFMIDDANVENVKVQTPARVAAATRPLELEDEMESKARIRDQALGVTQMNLTPEGRAWQFVNQILLESEKLQAKNATVPVKPVANDDLYFTTLKLLEKQEEFFASNVDFTVDVGFHYTASTNLDNIRSNGLLTKPERQQQGVTDAIFHGAVFGEGVYTADNPFAFSNYGDIGLICARLRGTTKRVAQGVPNTDSSVHCVTGNKIVPSTTEPHFADEVVLQSSTQIIPLMQFEQQPFICDSGDSKNARWQDSGINTIMEDYIATLRNIIDSMFNGSQHGAKTHGSVVSTAVSTAFSSSAMSAANSLHSSPRTYTSHHGTAPISVLCETIQYTAPDFHHSHKNLFTTLDPSAIRPSDGTLCAICHCPMDPTDQLATPLGCGHTFHEDCLQRSLLHSSKCPICRITISRVQGEMPSGTMTVTVSPSITCEGFAPGTIIITYSFPSGIQKSYHDNPGVAHDAATRIAYLPNNHDGQMLLKRLKFAFCHGLCFTVTLSVSTGLENSVTWASIQHKTSLTGGQQNHGFPDFGYILNCNEDLDDLSVPSAYDCP